ncbi:hypothetical protein LHK12_17570 [Providencia rettgeri]|nr:hypothetical protein [Providencia rettgeri]
MDKLIDSLSSQGWYVWDDFMSLQHIQTIKNSIPDTLQDARIGRGDTLQGNKSIRADQTVWLEPEMGSLSLIISIKWSRLGKSLTASFILVCVILKRISAVILMVGFIKSILITQEDKGVVR